MFLKLKCDWNGHPAGSLIFMDDPNSARRLQELAVAELPARAEIEAEVMRNDTKQSESPSNKMHKPVRNKGKRGRPPGSRNKPHAG